MLTPEDRACLEWAYRVVIGFGPETDVYAARDLTLLAMGDTVSLDPSGDGHDALIAALAQAMKLHIAGAKFGELRRDLIAAGMGEEAANRVHDHLVDVSVEEWDRLRERVAWYGNDNGTPIPASTALSGGS